MNRLLPAVAASLALMAASPALAHPGHGAGLAGGFLHPLTGADHVLAMLAVGLWAALRGRRAALAWPAAFVAAMAAGFMAVQAGLVLPQLEAMIAGSVILLGAAIALRLAAPVWLGAVAIAAFGLFHGGAHGMELHGEPLPFAAGFLIASVTLHGIGYALAIALERLALRWSARLAGAGIAAAGLAIAGAAI